LAHVPAEAVLVLTETLRDIDAQVRIDTIHALGKIGPAAVEAIPGLIEVLHSINRSMPLHAAYALMKMGPAGTESVSDMIESLTGTVEAARFLIICRLGNIPFAVGPHLIEVLYEANELLCGIDTDALGKIGLSADDATFTKLLDNFFAASKVHDLNEIEKIVKRDADAASTDRGV